MKYRDKEEIFDKNAMLGFMQLTLETVTVSVFGRT